WHSSYALYGRSGKGRFSIYVPDELAEDVEKAIQNGRDLQKLMTEAGRRYTLALKNQRRTRSGKWRPLGRPGGDTLLNEPDFLLWCKPRALTKKAQAA